MDNQLSQPPVTLPTDDAVTYGKAKTWLQNWQDFISYEYADSGLKPPIGVFIPLPDILAMMSYYHQNSKEMAGVRIYFALENMPDPGKLSNDIKVVMVPAKDVSIVPNQHFEDVIEKVGPLETDPDKQLYSIYDVCQPCPPCCGSLQAFLGIKL